MIRTSIELFIDNKRKYISVPLKDLAHNSFPDLLSAGVETGIFDKNNNAIYTNHYVKCQGFLCRLTIDEGTIMIKHPSLGLIPLSLHHQSCEVIR